MPKARTKRKTSQKRLKSKKERKSHKTKRVRSIYDIVPPLESYSVSRDMYKEALEAHEKEFNKKDQSAQTSQEELESIIVVTNEDLNNPVTESSTECTSYDTSNSSTQT